MLRSKEGVTFSLNGEPKLAACRPDLPLLTYLHEEAELTGTKLGCGIGECRACTVAVRREPGAPLAAIQACVTPLRNIVGWEVFTVEGLDDSGSLHPLQNAFLDFFAFQCGYCTPGFLMGGVALLDQLQASPDEEGALPGRIDAVIGRNLCRCTGYGRYHDAIAKVALAEGLVTPAKALVESIPEAPGDSVLEPRRVFDSPLLELVRLLRAAAEIEHSLMLQYLYAAFAVRTPRYANLAGWGNHQYAGRPIHLLGVAIEEMGHLHVVNRLLVALGGAPNLGRQQFPFESDLYPFPLNLEPLSPLSVARYVYVEAPASALDYASSNDSAHHAFLDKLYAVLGRETRPNRLQPLYEKVERLLREVVARDPGLLDDVDRWVAEIAAVRHEGESEHFELFRNIFLGHHAAFDGVGDPWNLPPFDADHPSLPVAINPSAFRTGNQIRAQEYRQVAWLANLHYWTVCMLLSLSYQSGGSLLLSARRLMAGPLRSLGVHLAHAGVGIPFDALNTGYEPGIDRAANRRLALELLGEVETLEYSCAPDLPDDYPMGFVASTRNELKLDAIENP